MLSADEWSQAGSDGRFKTALNLALSHHPVRRQRNGDTFQRLWPQLLALKQAGDQTIGSGTDDHTVGLCLLLQSGGNIGRLAHDSQRFACVASAHLASDNK